MNDIDSMNKEQLFTWINQLCFCADDMMLYLDTHPEDADAAAPVQADRDDQVFPEEAPGRHRALCRQCLFPFRVLCKQEAD